MVFGEGVTVLERAVRGLLVRHLQRRLFRQVGTKVLGLDRPAGGRYSIHFFIDRDTVFY